VKLIVLHSCKVKSKFATAVTVEENKTMATAEEDVNHLPIYAVDPKLEEFKDHFSYRMKRYLDQKRSIEKNEGTLRNFPKVRLSPCIQNASILYLDAI
jgi:1,4-alpha-glucan branching enzyme